MLKRGKDSFLEKLASEPIAAGFCEHKFLNFLKSNNYLEISLEPSDPPYVFAPGAPTDLVFELSKPHK